MLAAATRETFPSQLTPLEQMFFDYHDLVYRTAFRVTGNSSDAEDVLQTVFMRLARQKSLPTLGESAPGYFRRAAINAAIDLLRSNLPGRNVPLEDVEMHLAEQGVSSPEHRVMALEIRQFLRRSIAGFNPRDAEMFVLSAFEGFGNKEIAALFRLRHTTVGVILHRVRIRLLNEMRSILGE